MSLHLMGAPQRIREESRGPLVYAGLQRIAEIISPHGSRTGDFDLRTTGRPATLPPHAITKHFDTRGISRPTRPTLPTGRCKSRDGCVWSTAQSGMIGTRLLLKAEQTCRLPTFWDQSALGPHLMPNQCASIGRTGSSASSIHSSHASKPQQCT